MNTGFIIMTSTLCQGAISGCHDEDSKPVIFDTEDAAWKEIADNKITELQQFIDGERTREETNFIFDEWVEPAAVYYYDVVSPDGFSISFDGVWPSIEEATAAFIAWRDRYKGQGYYSNSVRVKIPLDKLHESCYIAEMIEDKGEDFPYHYTGKHIQIVLSSNQ